MASVSMYVKAQVDALVAAAKDRAQGTGVTPVSGLGTGTPSSGKYVDGGSGAWTTLPTATTGASTEINVKSAPYNAAGNGTTDDTTAIQAALTAAATAGGGVVRVPAGVYVINKYLLISSATWLRGDGRGISTIRCGSTFTSGGTAPMGGGYSMIQCAATGQSNVSVSHLTFDGNESVNRSTLSTASGRVVSYLVDMRNVTGLTLEQVATRNTWTYNIMVKDCSKFLVTGCDVQSPNTTAVYSQLDGIHILGSNQGRVIGNNVDNGVGSDADDGMVCHVIGGGNPCYDITYANNVVRGGANANGFQFAGDAQIIRDITVTGNVFWGCNKRGIFTNFYATSGNQPIRSITITGNTIRDTTTYEAILIHCAYDGKWEDITISGNVIDGYGSSANNVPGIGVEGSNSSRGISITGNTIRNGYSRGISLYDSAPQVADYIIANNVIDLTAAAAGPLAILLGMSKDGVVANNLIVGRGTSDGTGIYMTSATATTATNQVITGNRMRAFIIAVYLTNASGNNPTNTLITSNIMQGCPTQVSAGTATVTTANNV